jgi:DNA repair exonuclease SbcCD ATPase subunit
MSWRGRQFEVERYPETGIEQVDRLVAKYKARVAELREAQARVKETEEEVKVAEATHAYLRGEALLAGTTKATKVADEARKDLERARDNLSGARSLETRLPEQFGDLNTLEEEIAEVIEGNREKFVAVKADGVRQELEAYAEAEAEYERILAEAEAAKAEVRARLDDAWRLEQWFVSFESGESGAGTLPRELVARRREDGAPAEWRPVTARDLEEEIERAHNERLHGVRCTEAEYEEMRETVPRDSEGNLLPAYAAAYLDYKARGLSQSQIASAFDNALAKEARDPRALDVTSLSAPA